MNSSKWKALHDNTFLPYLLPNQAVEDSAWAIAKTVGTLVVSKLDGVGPVDNIPSTNKIHHFVQKNVTCDMWHMTRADRQSWLFPVNFGPIWAISDYQRLNPGYLPSMHRHIDIYCLPPDM